MTLDGAANKGINDLKKRFLFECCAFNSLLICSHLLQTSLLQFLRGLIHQRFRKQRLEKLTKRARFSKEHGPMPLSGKRSWKMSAKGLLAPQKQKTNSVGKCVCGRGESKGRLWKLCCCECLPASTRAGGTHSLHWSHLFFLHSHGGRAAGMHGGAWEQNHQKHQDLHQVVRFSWRSNTRNHNLERSNILDSMNRTELRVHHQDSEYQNTHNLAFFLFFFLNHYMINCSAHSRAFYLHSAMTKTPCRDTKLNLNCKYTEDMMQNA